MRTYSVSTAVLAAVLVSVACRSTPIRNEVRAACSAGVRVRESCSADGAVLVLAVDDHRILIAIDEAGADKPDGFVDDLFLYTASEAHGFQNRVGAFPGHIEYHGNTLRVVAKDGPETLLFLIPQAEDSADARLDARVERRFDRSIGLSHYAGWLKVLPLDRLGTFHVSAQCDGPRGACVEVDGVRIQFPA